MTWANKLKGLPISERVMHGLGLTLDSDEVDVISSGYHYRTFPKTWIFRDEEGWRWKKVGNSIFSFCGHHARVPEGKRVLKTWVGDKTLTLVCDVRNATINNHVVLDEAYQKDYDGASVSTVCGRAQLVLISWSLT
jgi:hypothetical protein